MNDIFIREIPLPLRVRGVTVTDENGDYNIYVNSRIAEAAKTRAIKHETEHIRLDHFFSSFPTAELECEVLVK